MVTGRCISLFLNVIFWYGPGRERSKELWVYLKSTSEWGAKVITYGWTQQKIKHLFINLWSKPQQALKNDKLWSECEHARQNCRSCDMLTWNYAVLVCYGSVILPSCYQVEVTKGDISNLCGSLCTFLFWGNQPFKQRMLKGGHERNVALQIDGFCGVDPLAVR